MKTSMTGFAAVLMLAACEPAPAPPGPYDNLGGALRVSFSDNPGVAEEACNPNVEYALRSEDDALRLNVTYLINDETFASSGFAIVDRSEDGELDVLTATEALSMFDPIDGACSDTAIKVHEFICQSGADSAEPVPCPAIAFVGTEMFASFTELAD